MFVFWFIPNVLDSNCLIVKSCFGLTQQFSHYCSWLNVILNSHFCCSNPCYFFTWFSPPTNPPQGDFCYTLCDGSWGGVVFFRKSRCQHHTDMTTSITVLVSDFTSFFLFSWWDGYPTPFSWIPLPSISLGHEQITTQNTIPNHGWYMNARNTSGENGGGAYKNPWTPLFLEKCSCSCPLSCIILVVNWSMFLLFFLDNRWYISIQKRYHL